MMIVNTVVIAAGELKEKFRIGLAEYSRVSIRLILLWIKQRGCPKSGFSDNPNDTYKILPAANKKYLTWLPDHARKQI
jgi:hypothetical protein